MAGIPNDSGHMAYIVAKRAPLERLSPAARHQAMPTLYAKPVAFPSTDEALRAEIKTLTRQKGELVAENARLKAEIHQLKAAPPIAAGSFTLATTLRGAPTVKELMRVGCEVAGVSFEDMMGRSRQRHIAYPRHLAIWLVREIRWDLSLPQLGIAFGRDHTTIMSALSNVAKLREMSPFKDWLADQRIQDVVAACKKGGAS